MKFTIQAVNTNGSVDVKFDVDNKVQNISGLPISDKEALELALAQYGEAYASGLTSTTEVADPAIVKAKAIDADAILAAQEA